jgi:hypothetical protein
MDVQLTWQVGNEEGKWETISTADGRSRRKTHWWSWGVLLTMLAALIGGGGVTLRHRYARAQRQIVFQIQSVIDLETRALEQGDLDLFMAQQDEASRAWYARQAVYVHSGRQRCRSNAIQASSPAVTDVLQKDCPPTRPPQVQDVELMGDVAWVEVVNDRESVRQARFYRQTGRGWVHTAPRVEFWKDPVELVYGKVIVLAHERDLPYIEPLVAHILQVVKDTGTMIGSSAASTLLEIEFSIEVPADELPDLSGDVLTLASPWLTGMPIEGAWDGEYLEKAAYWVAYAMVSQSIAPIAGRDLSLLQRAIVDEYATWCSQKDLAQAPILRIIADRHGADVLPEMLHSVKSAPLASQFMAEWLFHSPPQEGVYFAILSTIASEAAQVGRKDTVRLVDLLLLEYVIRWGG